MRTVLRARKEEDKDERRRVLLDAARSLFEEQHYTQVKIADVAARAGLAKGTVFVYYPTKESLFLALTETLLVEWIEGLEREVEATRGKLGSARAARILASGLVERPTLTRLLAILGSVLEQEADPERILAFKRKLVEGLARIGVILERKLAFLGPGGGAHLLVRTYALVVGLHALCEVSPNAKKVLDSHEDVGSLRFDFAQELESALLLLLRGLEKDAG
ncbi:TetR/AcrR family transcriptional regulator [Sandaracinus amylolyticus]|uniref:TetR/AcrR family transcriptional regulator n=1 Tax=Sandaracinus amylolyticus TaxID=927083 RepID=UPI001F1DDAE9|nr:TetR family transcriptional regulator [Sandaracinus amylolyticus]UJR86571.1 Hypothetical protein I5071_86720 [Sandaracinus amylolyticus]